MGHSLSALQPDLVVSQIVIVGTKETGLSLTFQATVTNRGRGTATASVLRFTLDGTTLFDVAVPSLLPRNVSVVIAPAWTATVGNHNILATADILGTVVENNEANNSRRASFTVTDTAPQTFVSPSGILSGSSTAFTNDHVDGRYRKFYWADFQPTDENNFSWDVLDGLVASAQSAGKTMVVNLNLNSPDPTKGLVGLPQWLIDKGATVYNVDSHDSLLPAFLPWDPVWQSYALKFIAAFGDRYDGQIASVSMGGLGISTETHMPEPSPDGKTTQEAADAWLASSSLIAAQYAAHLKQTSIIAAISVPYSGTAGINALQSFADNAVALYGKQMGFENWGLNANSSQNYLPNKIIYDHRLTNPVGFQMTGGATSGGGGDLQGTLREAMEAGVALGAQYLEVFGSDCDNPIYFDDLDAVSMELLPPPR